MKAAGYFYLLIAAFDVFAALLSQPPIPCLAGALTIAAFMAFVISTGHAGGGR